MTNVKEIQKLLSARVAPGPRPHERSHKELPASSESVQFSKPVIKNELHIWRNIEYKKILKMEEERRRLEEDLANLKEEIERNKTYLGYVQAKSLECANRARNADLSSRKEDQPIQHQHERYAAFGTSKPMYKDHSNHDVHDQWNSPMLGQRRSQEPNQRELKANMSGQDYEKLRRQKFESRMNHELRWNKQPSPLPPPPPYNYNALTQHQGQSDSMAFWEESNRNEQTIPAPKRLFLEGEVPIVPTYNGVTQMGHTRQDIQTVPTAVDNKIGRESVAVSTNMLVPEALHHQRIAQQYPSLYNNFNNRMSSAKPSNSTRTVSCGTGAPLPYSGPTHPHPQSRPLQPPPVYPLQKGLHQERLQKSQPDDFRMASRPTTRFATRPDPIAWPGVENNVKTLLLQGGTVRDQREYDSYVVPRGDKSSSSRANVPTKEQPEKFFDGSLKCKRCNKKANFMCSACLKVHYCDLRCQVCRS